MIDEGWRNVTLGDELTMPALQIERHRLDVVRIHDGAEPMTYGEFVARQAACDHVWRLGLAHRLHVRFCSPCQTYQLQTPGAAVGNRG